ncbi:hypothetical protein N7452_009183 [Penicillium brevicompactum]|uniref:Uncharacterized protein n=1 Tax=Penicillium brevicompactum TaxID=5074 RepID=A0A9W9QB43_PENBR|nr:hypothetical protein N7452_009183 [Penicillium brevicompactum]
MAQAVLADGAYCPSCLIVRSTTLYTCESRYDYIKSKFDTREADGRPKFSIKAKHALDQDLKQVGTFEKKNVRLGSRKINTVPARGSSKPWTRTEVDYDWKVPGG